MPKYIMHHQTNTSAASVAAAAGVPIMSPQVSVPSSVPLQMALPGQVAMAPPMSMAAAPLAASPFPTHAHHPGVSFGGPAHVPVITAAPMMMHARPQMIQVAQPHPQLMMAASPAAQKAQLTLVEVTEDEQLGGGSGRGHCAGWAWSWSGCGTLQAPWA